MGSKSKDKEFISTGKGKVKVLSVKSVRKESPSDRDG